MKTFCMAALAVIALTFGFQISTSVPAHADSCKTAAQKTAFHVRSLQTDLSEAGFSCDMAAEYADIKKRFGKHLGTHSRVLEKRFRKLHGGKGKRKFETYITDVANRAALRAAIKRDRFCTRAKGLYSATKGMKPKDLGSYAMKVVDADTDVPDTCK